MNKNIIIISSIVIIFGILTIAQTGNQDLITGMTGYKMAKDYSSGTVLGVVALKLVAVAVVSFIFSVIFWSTHKWMMVKKKKR